MIKTPIILIALLVLAFAQKHNVTQFTERTFEPELEKSEFSLVYVYSSTEFYLEKERCGYCQQFTPLYEKLSKETAFVDQQVRFLKVDESLFKNYTEKFSIHSFPTVMLFWKDYSEYPIFYRQERTEENLRQFIEQSIKITEDKIDESAILSPYQRVEDKIVLYHGKKDSPVYKQLGLVAKRDQFFSWKLIPLKEGEEEKVTVGNKNILKSEITIDSLEQLIGKVFARVHTLSEEPWVRIFMNKQLGVAHINPNKNKKYDSLMLEMAQKYTNLVFLDLSPEHPEYKAALRTFGIYDEENIIAVDRKSEAVFVANEPHTSESLTEFIQKVQKYEWPVYRKTEKTTKEEKLTRENFKERMSTNQDVVLFLYRRQEKISKNLIDLFNHLRNKLKENKNLLFLRCDVASNEIEEYLEFTVEKTPKIIFYRNRMKDRPIHFSTSKISESSVIEFIMENTTFDWNDEWAEL